MTIAFQIKFELSHEFIEILEACLNKYFDNYLSQLVDVFLNLGLQIQKLFLFHFWHRWVKTKV